MCICYSVSWYGDIYAFPQILVPSLGDFTVSTLEGEMLQNP